MLAASRVKAVAAGRFLERWVVPTSDRVGTLLVYIGCAGRRVIGSVCAILLVNWLFQGRLACVDHMLQVGV